MHEEVCYCSAHACCHCKSVCFGDGGRALRTWSTFWHIKLITNMNVSMHVSRTRAHCGSTRSTGRAMQRRARVLL